MVNPMRKIGFGILVLLAIISLFVAGCTQPPPVVQPVQQPATTLPTTVPTTQLPDTVRTADTSFGRILTDAQGKTLYFSGDDVQGGGASSCTDQCSTDWPVFSVDALRVSAPLNPSDFGFITRADGTKQAAYRGRPLYYSSLDTKPGDINGSAIDKVWNVANIAGTVATAQPTTIPTTRQTPSLAGGGGGGGGGY
jgi:predicted lipoprotein with Yx(FWY)xxD motif